MDEIRFRYSEEVAAREAKLYYESRTAWFDLCSTCGHHRKGHFHIVDGTFECWRCFASRRFTELVGEREEY